MGCHALKFYKKPKLSVHEIADMLENYANQPDLSMMALGEHFGISEALACYYISKYFFGTFKGEKLTITLQSKINNNG